MPDSLATVLADIAAERAAQDARWGVQEFPDGTGTDYTDRAREAKDVCRTASSAGELTWRHVLTEEFLEALAESDPERLRAELVQTAAVAVQWVQALDRRRGRTAGPRGDGHAEKLVRDRVPEIIQRSGREPHVRIAADGEYAALLRAKLYEEAGEYVSSHDPEELADLLEVIRALGSAHGVEPAELEELRAAKAAERGGFAGRLVLRLPGPPPAGSEPVRRHSVRAILLDGEDLVLLRRTVRGREPYWTTPGGGIEPEDAGPEDALRRELDEELGAIVSEPHQVFTFVDRSPGLCRTQTFYLCRLVSMDLSRRHGPEFDDPSKGGYDVERVPLTAEALGEINLVPGPLADFVRASAARLRCESP
jgi:predicted house-cleaning noncanonical NTP pyrophosphatase (MazG superfamily)/8-oxo-dGTP pyrophosphatase MutT (NUDIX family)